MRSVKLRTFSVTLLVALLMPLLVAGQGRRTPASFRQVVEHDGNLVFTRLVYGSGLGGFGGFGGAAWSHDYPAADRNLSAILDHITHIRVHLEGTNVLGLDDPEIFQNPVLYVWEPGYWSIQPSEAENLRRYLLKGGFVIFDDFEGPDHWANLVAQMRRALPGHTFIKIDVSHPIFHAFYDITKLDVPHPSMDVLPGYYAMFENNDPGGRMMALANHNSDIAEYWEWSAEGLYNPDPTNDAYRLGVNYFVYAMTH
ncbi:MAG TPA: DUF4159 domain-containing protein [Vicinamibacterales bacterium]|nr:DUF4159 domain-containing protein [Vicinamibacterales bacterium]